MPKNKITILCIKACLLTGVFFLILTNECLANFLPMPNIKGQFKKGDLKETKRVTLQADQVSFNSSDNKAHAKGNVVVNSKDQHLYCDELQLDRVIQEVVAEGNVYLDTPQEQVIAQGLTYNFNDGTGEFREANVFIDPYRVEGQKIDKRSETYMTVDNGYLTTCDLDEPHFRMSAHRMDIYQHDRAVIHGMKIYLGKVPVMYMPYYVQDLKNRPIITFVPGESKNFGLFLLSTARLQVGTHVKLTLHADVRERVGFGQGADIKYDTPNFGHGLVSAYYADEHMIASHHLWDLYNSQGVKRGPTTHHELYRIIWRHKWQIDQDTNLVVQYYKIHDYDLIDNYFLKNYFKRDYLQNAQNANYDTYFFLTRVMPHGTLTFDVDTSRENRPIRGIERIPEVQYTLNNQQIGKSGFYVKSTNTFSDLSYQNYPKTFNEKTMRFDTNNDISHPFKVGFIQFNPHLGGENTYYSRTTDVNHNNIIRGMFRGSLDMSTHVYKVWDYHTNFAGLNINGLRHVITPTITYLYQARPTTPATSLNQYDPAIDDLYRIHEFQLGLENKLQTKRNGEVVDLLRFLITTTYGLKGTKTFFGAPGHRGFNPYDSVLDFDPTDWLTFHNDNEYDFHTGHWNTENFDGEIHNDKWAFSLGSRYTRHQGDQVTSELDYTINPKWKFKVFYALPIIYATNGNTNSAREFDLTLTRDLHEWEMDMTLDRQEGQGTTFYILFRLKASPGMKFNLFQSSFQASRPGSQSN